MVNFDIEFQISSTNWRLRKNWNFFLHPRDIVSFFFFFKGVISRIEEETFLALMVSSRILSRRKIIGIGKGISNNPVF